LLFNFLILFGFLLLLFLLLFLLLLLLTHWQSILFPFLFTVVYCSLSTLRDLLIWWLSMFFWSLLLWGELLAFLVVFLFFLGEVLIPSSYLHTLDYLIQILDLLLHLLYLLVLLLHKLGVIILPFLQNVVHNFHLIWVQTLFEGLFRHFFGLWI